MKYTIKTVVLLLAYFVKQSDAFAAPIFQEIATQQKTAPSKEQGVEIELPNFDELFGRLQAVSPLAKVAIQQPGGALRGFHAIDDTSGLRWKSLESNSKRLVHQVDKIDDFQGLGCPIIRLRSTIDGPCVNEAFAAFIMDVDERAKWDPSIGQVCERYPIKDLDMANVAMGFGKYGDCVKLGVGYCQTKSYGPVSGREQLTLCGIQEFQDGSAVVWGTEMEPWHNHLFPPGERLPRSKSHLFSIAIVPTSENQFDVEYCLQIDVGGIPNWITTPILIETIKGMFGHAQKFYGGEQIQKYIEEHPKEDKMDERNSILMTP
mmetsp:Transcript_29292/g.41472  ORF Transcript_29292/g.41472 Transcript_29292/m.41472 type:complete len:319 (+) Transcript_29292:60-1016(+)